MLVRIANREDLDQTVSSEAVYSGSALFSRPLMAGNRCPKFYNIYQNKIKYHKQHNKYTCSYECTLDALCVGYTI